MNLSIVVPVYNEEKVIQSTINFINETLKKSNIEKYEIIVVNDGSTDDTSSVLLNNEIDCVVVNHENNKGYGASLKTGVKVAKFEIIATIDADGTYPIDKIPELFNYMKVYDMVVGARTGKNVKIPLSRKPAKWFINKLANFLTGTKIPDINSGLRFFKKNECLKYFKILPSGFSFSTTITLAMITNEKKVKFIPINYDKRIGKSKIKPIRDTINFIILIIRTVLYFNPLKVFVSMSFFLFFLSFLVLLLSYFLLHKILDATVSIIFLTGVQMLAIGMIADIIDKQKQ